MANIMPRKPKKIGWHTKRGKNLKIMKNFKIKTHLTFGYKNSKNSKKLSLDTVCKNGQHNGAKPQTLNPKNRKMLMPTQPGRTSILNQRGTLVLSLLTNDHQK